MEADNLQLISQMLQAILIASSALAGFMGIVIVQFVHLTRRTMTWDRLAIGGIALWCGTSFILCVFTSIEWFYNQFQYPHLALSPDPGTVRFWFISQSISFLLLFLVYIGASFFNSKE